LKKTKINRNHWRSFRFPKLVHFSVPVDSRGALSRGRRQRIALGDR
jgi:hypothetical protein